MHAMDREWDFFLAHAAADSQKAEELYDLLTESASVFLDTRTLELGDNWDLELPAAQERSRITVVLVSTQLDAAYYQRVEVAKAINLSRNPASEHRVIPLYVDEASTKGLGATYGLSLKQGLVLSEKMSLEAAAFRLLTTLKRLRYQRVLFESQNGGASQFWGYPDTYWSTENGQSVRSSDFAQGEMTIERGGILSIRQTSPYGRFVVQLLEREAARSKHVPMTFPPPGPTARTRNVWIQCEVCTDGAGHALQFILRDDASSSWIASERRLVKTADWSEINMFFRLESTVAFSFRIAAEEPVHIPSQVRLRHLAIREY